MTFDPKELERVFGSDSSGSTAEQRAKTSARIFIRSQLQLAEDNSLATGHRMTATEALVSYGWESLKRVAADGSCPLITDQKEPATTLRLRRIALNLTLEQVARQSNLSASLIKRAEEHGALSRIRDLEQVAQTLALNDKLIGVTAGAKGDERLGVRLREMAKARDSRRFSPTDVLQLAESAWVISSQASLRTMNEGPYGVLHRFYQKSWDYNYPSYEKGYALAKETRQRVDMDQSEPIESLKSLVEDRLGISVVQQALSNKFAGATVDNSGVRGVVVNEKGMNANVWVRRMTLAHELCHLLWDPDTRLDRLRVDDYETIENSTDSVEIRANAFAVAFLAPPEGVRAVMRESSSHVVGLSEVMDRFGISATAAKYHIRNVTGLDVSHVALSSLPTASDDWIGRENLTVDYFRPSSTPISRRGKFAWFVVSVWKKKLITLDTASLYLKCSEDDFTQSVDFIQSALGPA
jgi:Zn-dependent peptidase ImmA (M78 family)/transcriptional regulator with XRE-family HTH domain